MHCVLQYVHQTKYCMREELHANVQFCLFHHLCLILQIKRKELEDILKDIDLNGDGHVDFEGMCLQPPVFGKYNVCILVSLRQGCTPECTPTY